MTRPVNGRVTPEQRRSTGAPAPSRAGRDHPAGTHPGPGTARIAVDLLGGDHAPAVVVDGALRACQADPSLQLLLAGPETAARALLAALPPADRARVRHLPGDGTPGPGGREPTAIGVAVRAVAAGVADAVVSAGPTGATVTAAALGLGRRPDLRRPDPRSPDPRSPDLRGADLRGNNARGNDGRGVAPRRLMPRRPGSRRPALAAVLPTATGRVVLLDVGASVDPDAATLAAHAQLGAAYAIAVHGLSAARVGLLSIGTEDGKGDRVRRIAGPLFDGLPLPAGARYVGLVEGHEAVLGRHADVVVTDAFTGNVLLKGVEAAYALAGDRIRGDAPPRAALLLGIAGTCVVCHGAADADDVASGIALAARLHRQDAVANLTALLPGGDPTATGTIESSTSDYEVST